MSAYYPVYLDLNGRSVVVVGGGEPATRRVVRLLEAGAEVTVIAPELTPELDRLAAAEALLHVARPFRPGDLVGARLVFAERLDPATNAAVFAEAEERGVFANVEDDLPHSSYIAPARVSRGDLQIAISTSGSAPALAVRLRQRLERELGHEYAELLDLARRLRAPLLAAVPDFEERRARWYRLVDSAVLQLLRDGERQAARDLAVEIMGVEPADRGASAGNGAAGHEPAPSTSTLEAAALASAH